MNDSVGEKDFPKPTNYRGNPYRLDHGIFGYLRNTSAEIDAHLTDYVLKPFIEGIQQKYKDPVILDLAAGSSGVTTLLRGLGAKTVTTDLSHAASTLQKNGTQADIFQLPFAYHSFHGLFCKDTIATIPPASRIDLYKEISRVVIPGGSICIITPEIDLYSPDPDTGDRVVYHGQYMTSLFGIISDLKSLKFTPMISQWKPPAKKDWYLGQKRYVISFVNDNPPHLE